MELTNLHELFINELQDLYDGEQQIIQALPMVVDKSHTTELKQSLTQHFSETQEQARKLEKLSRDMGIELGGKACVGMEGLIEEAVELMQENDPSPLLDLALIGSTQKIEHFEISGYGTAANYAQEMAHTVAQNLLHEIMDEEKKADQKLSQVAEKLFKSQQFQTQRYAM